MIDAAIVGNRLEIHHQFENGSVKAYASQIQDILLHSQIVVYAPMERGTVVRLPNGDNCDIIVYTEKGIVKTHAQIMRNVVKNDVFYLVMRLTSGGEKIQRRDFYRFDCLLNFKFAIIDKETVTEENKTSLAIDYLYSGLIKDIGGGGIRFLSNDDIEEKIDICSIISLEGEVIMPIGVVLHKQEINESNYTWQYRVQFQAMPQYEQERIVHYIFNEQRKQLKRTR